jgi:hypothetical protein
VLLDIQVCWDVMLYGWASSPWWFDGSQYVPFSLLDPEYEGTMIFHNITTIHPWQGITSQKTWNFTRKPTWWNQSLS